MRESRQRLVGRTQETVARPNEGLGKEIGGLQAGKDLL